ncbi:HyaD/HybD family hydrogenase maturation endopeptidase [Thiocapsa bogorovii]|uniref:Hydrogenase expression/formation protein HupD n=1 Tax=Thiocapsa roseopersicina TaxID=1058 RepID=HUPD_THIRO|nr:HyaD/HybD family hydrogenase maturation endopeptidase [Thiocapsa bogorovii]Q56362.1 RecName: Full=Hydrogenase expression/formation protein HupD [Thiocapsa roseopersicina]AAA27412.1 HupD [Thiocapsa roseopersicina]UHD18854.1 HyaD/HybD family hydrogenase maturation endopeptidase [Thiocapsa bogorovii]
MRSDPEILVLGIGNLLWADEGFGVRAVEALQRHWVMSSNVQLLDGGTQGIYLVDRVRKADVLVVFDAVDYGLPPGTMKRVEDDEVPRFLGAKKMSLHQTGFQEVLALAAMLGDYPKHLLLIGVQPVELDDFGGSLRPQIKERITPAIEMALEYLAQFGVVARRREDSTVDSPHLPHPSLDLIAYESGRPGPEIACRIGDERVLTSLSARTVQPGNPHGDRQ